MVSREEFEELKGKLALYEEQQKSQAVAMKAEVEQQVSHVAGGLRELYEQVSTSMKELESRIRKLEERLGSGGGASGKKSLLHPKHVLPDKLEKREDWRQWKSDVEDYCEELFEGMKDILEKVKKSEDPVDHLWFHVNEEHWWERGEMLWRFLKRYTAVGGEGRKVVMGVRDDNGWEAWRKLNVDFEPALVAREAHVMAHYTSLVNRRAKSPQETRTLMVELEERGKRVEEISGERVDKKHEMSVIVGILDPETLKHTAQYQGMKSDVEVLKRKIMEFVNLVTGGGNGSGYAKGDAMDIGRVEEMQNGVGEAFENDEWGGNDGEEVQDGVYGLGERCYICGGAGHYARECPYGKGSLVSKGSKGSKGGGKSGGFSKGNKGFKGGSKGDGGTKGKGKGESKGGGKGKGGPQFGVCWTCGGPHFSRDCPMNQGKGAWGNPSGAIRCLCNLAVHEVKGDVTRKMAMRCEEIEDVKDEPPPVVDDGESERESFEEKIKDEEEAGDSDDGEVCVSAWVEVKSKRTLKRDRQRQNRRCRMQTSTAGGLGSLLTVMPDGVNAVEVSDEWDVIEMAVDSGATETVLNDDMLTSVETVEGEACKRGVQYEVASGGLIPNIGEKRFVAVSDSGMKRRMRAQVCDVNKALLSVAKTVKAGNRVVFDDAGSYIEDKQTGERMYLEERAGMYMLKLWVQRGQSF